MKRQNLIYAVFDTREPERVRYVGKTTTNLGNRMRNHWTYARNAPRPSKIQAWLRSRLTDPGTVGIRVISEVETEADLNQEEVYWIGYYRSIGQSDLNLTDGGEGVIGYVKSSESRKMLSERYRKSGGPSAKLTWDQVHAIREFRQQEYLGAKELGESYGVRRTAIDRILKNQLWYDPEFDPNRVVKRPPGSSEKAKLSMEQVRGIRSLRTKEWRSSQSLADQYEVTEGTIQHILDNRTYRDESYDPTSLAPRAPGEGGVQRGRKHLDEEAVRGLREMAERGRGLSEIAKTYRVTQGHARNIILRKTWRSV